MKTIISFLLSTVVIATPPVLAAPAADYHKEILQGYSKFKTLGDVINQLAKSADAKDIQWMKNELKEELNSPAPQLTWRGSKFQVKVKNQVFEFKIVNANGIIDVNGKELDLYHLKAKDGVERIREIYGNSSEQSSVRSLFLPEARAVILLILIGACIAFWAVAGYGVYAYATSGSAEKVAAAARDLEEASQFCNSIQNTTNAKPITELPAWVATGVIHGVSCARQKFPAVCDNLTALRKCLVHLQDAKTHVAYDDFKKIEDLLIRAKEGIQGEDKNAEIEKQVLKDGAGVHAAVH